MNLHKNDLVRFEGQVGIVSVVQEDGIVVVKFIDRRGFLLRYECVSGTMLTRETGGEWQRARNLYNQRVAQMQAEYPPRDGKPPVYNFVQVGWSGDNIVYFGVGLTKEEALERYRKEYPDLNDVTLDDVTEFQATSKFAAYDDVRACE